MNNQSTNGIRLVSEPSDEPVVFVETEETQAKLRALSRDPTRTPAGQRALRGWWD